MTQSNDLPTRVSRAEDNIIDLRLAASAMLQAIEKNSADIAELIEVSRYNLEVSRRNSEAISVLEASQLRTDEAIHDIREAIRDIREAIQDIRASNERMDRLFDYLIRRDRRQAE
jgi:DNA-binding FadR family transcriptional regulator